MHLPTMRLPNMHYLAKRKHEAENATIANGLGWASIGVGLTELLAPRALQRFMGIGNGQYDGTFRVLGIRELMHGVDLLSHKDPTCGVLGRTAGDMLDGVLLGIAAKKTKKPSGFLAICMLVLPLVVLDMFFSERLAARKLSS